MIHPDEALRKVLSFRPAPRTEEIDLSESSGRVLPREILSPLDIPPFDKSAMDGFACRRDDTSESFRIVETLAAGGGSPAPLAAGECSRIMTGAMLPPGADRVIRKEYCREGGNRMRVVKPDGNNVIARGENLRRGEALLGPRVLRAQDVGILASAGIRRVPVSVPPRVGIICTGSELKDPGERLLTGEIYNSNGPQLAAHAASTGCPAASFGIVPDSEPLIAESIEEAAGTCDVLLLSGGVSLGDFDYVPGVLAEAGFETVFHNVAVKPGKPTFFGHRNGRVFVFGLPGNPVSVFVMFEVFVKPFLFASMGIEYDPPGFFAPMEREVRRGQVERVEYLPVRRSGSGIEPLTYHGSSHLNVLSEADGLIRMEIGVAGLSKGESVHVRSI